MKTQLIEEDENSAIVSGVRIKALWSDFLFVFVSFIHQSKHDIRQLNIRVLLFKMRIILERSVFKLLNRKKLLIGSTVTIMYLSLIFCAIIGKSTDESTTVVALFAIGCLCVFLLNLPYVFWMFHNNQVLDQMDILQLL